MFEKIKDLLGLNNDYLFEWQRKLVPNSTKLTLTRAQLEQLTTETATTIIAQLNDSSKILQNTKEPSTFFMRLDFTFKRMNELKELEPYIKSISVSPSYMIDVANSEKQKIIKDFLYRYTRAVVKKTDSLKTAKSKKNNWHRNFIRY